MWLAQWLTGVMNPLKGANNKSEARKRNAFLREHVSQKSYFFCLHLYFPMVDLWIPSIMSDIANTTTTTIIFTISQTEPNRNRCRHSRFSHHQSKTKCLSIWHWGYSICLCHYHKPCLQSLKTTSDDVCQYHHYSLSLSLPRINFVFTSSLPCLPQLIWITTWHCQMYLTVSWFACTQTYLPRSLPSVKWNAWHVYSLPYSTETTGNVFFSDFNP